MRIIESQAARPVSPRDVATATNPQVAQTPVQPMAQPPIGNVQPQTSNIIQNTAPLNEHPIKQALRRYDQFIRDLIQTIDPDKVTEAEIEAQFAEAYRRLMMVFRTAQKGRTQTNVTTNQMTQQGKQMAKQKPL